MAKPTNPNSLACKFGQHTYEWGELSPGTKHLADVTTGQHVTTPAVFQVGICIRCGFAIKRTV